MEGLLTLLILAGFFYVVMRFGCGAHAVHGHGGSGRGGHAGQGEHRELAEATQPIDPESADRHTSVHGGAQ